MISVITQLLDEIREMVGCLHKLSECVAVLDMIVSFAHVCTVTPNYGETHTLSQQAEGCMCVEEPVGS